MNAFELVLKECKGNLLIQVFLKKSSLKSSKPRFCVLCLLFRSDRKPAGHADDPRGRHTRSWIRKVPSEGQGLTSGGGTRVFAKQMPDAGRKTETADRLPGEGKDAFLPNCAPAGRAFLSNGGKTKQVLSWKTWQTGRIYCTLQHILQQGVLTWTVFAKQQQFTEKLNS